MSYTQVAKPYINDAQRADCALATSIAAHECAAFTLAHEIRANGFFFFFDWVWFIAEKSCISLPAFRFGSIISDQSLDST
jgi:hypothetical protein